MSGLRHDLARAVFRETGNTFAVSLSFSTTALLDPSALRWRHAAPLVPAVTMTIPAPVGNNQFFQFGEEPNIDEINRQTRYRKTCGSARHRSRTGAVSSLGTGLLGPVVDMAILRTCFSLPRSSDLRVPAPQRHA